MKDIDEYAGHLTITYTSYESVSILIFQLQIRNFIRGFVHPSVGQFVMLELPAPARLFTTDGRVSGLVYFLCF